MAILDNSQEYVLNKQGVATLAKDLLAQVNARIKKRIVTEVDENSDNNHIPSAKCLYDAINNVDHIMALVIADGDITKAKITPDEYTLYIVRTSAQATEATPWIWIKPFGFVKACPTGSVEVDINPISDEDISDIVAKAAAETDPDLSVETATLTVTYVGADNVPAAISEEVVVGEIYSIDTPAMKGYTADIDTVTGTMTSKGMGVVVTYSPVD